MLKESETEDRGGYSCYVDSFQHFGRVLDFSEIVGRRSGKIGRSYGWLERSNWNRRSMTGITRVDIKNNY